MSDEKKSEMVKVKIRSTGPEDKYEVPITVGNRNGMQSYSIPRDKVVEVPRAVADALRNTTHEIVVPDMEYHEKNPHRLGDAPQEKHETVERFMYEIYE